ncbi:hypothetical protein [Aquimarina aquimarini]|uniref:hypothetical protein n=1 Tax=Aquimarina aquimarini TaxID=1191734 RepID=UPI00131ED3E8|nr:hypothetical protein [Aquimarina aquimarini]
METLHNNKLLFLILSLFIFMNCKGQIDESTDGGNTSISKSIENMSEEEIKKLCHDINIKTTQSRSDSITRVKLDSIRFKKFTNLTSSHLETDLKNDSIINYIATATPIVNDSGSLILSPSNISFSRFDKIKKISWVHEGDTITLSEIGHIYTIANDMLLVMDVKKNNILFFNPQGKQLTTVLEAPMLKSHKMIHGIKSFDKERYVVRPEGTPIEDNEGNIINYKTRKGDLGVFSSEEMILNGVKYLRVWIYGGNSIEAQFLNLETLKWENQAMWIGLI